MYHHAFATFRAIDVYFIVNLKLCGGTQFSIRKSRKRLHLAQSLLRSTKLGRELLLCRPDTMMGFSTKFSLFARWSALT